MLLICGMFESHGTSGDLCDVVRSCVGDDMEALYERNEITHLRRLS